MFEACLNMIKGEIMDKYTYKHGKKQGKEFSLTSDFLHFQWRPANSTRNIRKFLISDILEVIPGNTEFNCKNNLDIKTDSDFLCLTIKLKERPVNIVASSCNQRDMWVNGLKYLMKGYKHNSQEEILRTDSLLNEIYLKLLEEFQNQNEKDIYKSNDSFIIQNKESAKLNKKIKELEKNNAKLTKEIFEINSKADAEFTADDLKKIIKTKEKSEKKLQKQLELLNLQLENMESDFSQKILNFEEKLGQKDNKLLELQNEYDEFKKQIKESFNRTLVQKVQQYRESKEVMCSYVNFLKEKLETIEKEVALWQAVVHTHVLPIYQSKKPGKPPLFKQVLEFALDTMERKFLTDRSQTQFMSLLTEARKNVKT